MFECRFGCGKSLYFDGGSYYEESTDSLHKCSKVEDVEPDRDPSKHQPSLYLLDRDNWRKRIETLEREVARLKNPKGTGLDEFFWSGGESD
jgi:hypothetical protein